MEFVPRRYRRNCLSLLCAIFFVKAALQKYAEIAANSPAVVFVMLQRKALSRCCEDRHCLHPLAFETMAQLP
jgi:hypothetical protein